MQKHNTINHHPGWYVKSILVFLWIAVDNFRGKKGLKMFLFLKEVLGEKYNIV